MDWVKAPEPVMNTPTRITPSPAPALIDSSEGEASGLRVMVCNSRPLTASTLPQSMATMMRGRRVSTTSICGMLRLVLLGDFSATRTSPGVMCSAPGENMKAEAKPSAASSSTGTSHLSQAGRRDMVILGGWEAGAGPRTGPAVRRVLPAACPGAAPTRVAGAPPSWEKRDQCLFTDQCFSTAALT